MTIQDLKNERESIVAVITERVGAENVKRVMERMVIFVDCKYTNTSETPVAYAIQTINDMKIISYMKDSANVSKRAELVADGKMEDASSASYKMSHN